MLQCYASEASRGIPRRHRDRSDEDLQWTPVLKKRNVRGWARFLLPRQNVIKPLTRRQAALRIGHILHNDMVSGGQHVFSSWLRLDPSSKAFISPPPNVDLPTPDARFFNAALELFGRQPDMFPRRCRATRSYWRRQLRISNTRYDHFNLVSPHWSSSLQDVVQAMITHGFPIPHGFQHLFVGRWVGASLLVEQNAILNRSPFLFPRKSGQTFRPHSLATYKTRGLPVRNSK